MHPRGLQERRPSLAYGGAGGRERQPAPARAQPPSLRQQSARPGGACAAGWQHLWQLLRRKRER
eukprot:9591671-Prorocentrum_lima.AAC.1